MPKCEKFGKVRILRVSGELGDHNYDRFNEYNTSNWLLWSASKVQVRLVARHFAFEATHGEERRFNQQKCSEHMYCRVVLMVQALVVAGPSLPACMAVPWAADHSHVYDHDPSKQL